MNRKRMSVIRLGGILMAASLWMTSANASALIINHDLATDWSDISNPNGVWSYYSTGALGISQVRGGDSFGTAPLTWGNGASFLGWSKSNGTELFPHDWSAGQVFGHSTQGGDGIGIEWTATKAGTVSATAEFWEGRDIGRSNDWRLSFNGVILDSGTISSGDPFDSANPESAIFSGAVITGDVLRMDFVGNNGGGDYVALGWAVNLTVADAVPEMPTALLLVTGIAGLLGLRRRRCLS